MINRESFLQGVDVLATMYSWCWDVLYDGKPKHPSWCAVLLEGPMDQLRETQAEVHQYLHLPNPLPDTPLPPDGDPAPTIKNSDDFRLAVEALRRLYRTLGYVSGELGPFRQRLCAGLVGQIVPQLGAVHRALRAYLRWEEFERLSDELAAKYPPTDETPSPAVPVAPAQTREDNPVT
jgi:hypothetical protein